MHVQPLVSVIITTFNRSKLIVGCVDSVLQQDYSNLEVIVVDDCSTDGTDVLFQAQYSDRIRYIKHEFNKGVQYASNTGFESAKGKYVAFVGDDDRWNDTQKLKKQVEIFEKDTAKKYGVVTTDVKMITKYGSHKKGIKKPKNLVKHILRQNGVIYGSAALLRSDVFKQAGMFVEELPKGTDSDVFRRIVLLGYDIYFIDKDMVDYHFDAGDNMTSLTETGINRSILAQLYKLNRYREILKFYPSVRSHLLSEIGWYYMLRYHSSKNAHAKALSRKYFIKSLLSNPFNVRTWYRISKK